MTTHVCFDCGKDVETGDYFMVGLDIPYINLFFHKDCLKKIGGIDVINPYLSENTEKLYNYIEKVHGRSKK